MDPSKFPFPDYENAIRGAIDPTIPVGVFHLWHGCNRNYTFSLYVVISGEKLDHDMVEKIVKAINGKIEGKIIYGGDEANELTVVNGSWKDFSVEVMLRLQNQDDG